MLQARAAGDTAERDLDVGCTELSELVADEIRCARGGGQEDSVQERILGS